MVERNIAEITAVNIKDYVGFNDKYPGIIFVHAQGSGGYVNKDLLLVLESTGEKAIVLGDQRGDLPEYFKSKGIELTGNGFALLVEEKARVKFAQKRREAYNKAFIADSFDEYDRTDWEEAQQSAYEEAQQEIRHIGTTMPYLEASVDAVDIETGEPQTVTLLAFVTQDNLRLSKSKSWNEIQEIRKPSILVGLPPKELVYLSR